MSVERKSQEKFIEQAWANSIVTAEHKYNLRSVTCATRIQIPHHDNSIYGTISNSSIDPSMVVLKIQFTPSDTKAPDAYSRVVSACGTLNKTALDIKPNQRAAYIQGMDTLGLLHGNNNGVFATSFQEPQRGVVGYPIKNTLEITAVLPKTRELIFANYNYDPYKRFRMFKGKILKTLGWNLDPIDPASVLDLAHLRIS